MSNRKPHNDMAGYVCERKSHHPALPGHFVVIDRDNGGDWLDTGGDRWSVIHCVGDRTGCFLSDRTRAGAIETMKAMAGGEDDLDFGQHEESPWWEEAAVEVLLGKFGQFGRNELKKCVDIMEKAGETSQVRLVRIVAAACEMAEHGFKKPSWILTAVNNYEG